MGADRSGTPTGGHAADDGAPRSRRTPRRRGRLTLAIIGALALGLAAGALVAFVGDDDGGDLRLTAAGPAPADGTPPPAPPNQPPTGEVPPEVTTTTTVDSLTVTRVHPRTSPPQPADPVVRPPATDPSGSTSSPILAPPPSTTVAPSTAPAPAPCPAGEVGVTVGTDRAAYGPGQTVQGSSTLENRSASACLLPTRAFFRIVNAAGKDVGSFAYTLEFRMPVRAEPGKTFTSTFTWDQLDCAGSACAQVPPGTYTAVADWTEGGPYTGSTTFQITI